MPAKSQWDPDSPAARKANMLRARAEVAGPLLRAALQPVLDQIKPGWPGRVELTAESVDEIIAACRLADNGRGGP